MTDDWRHTAEQFFGERLPLAVRYVEFLAIDGVERGLIGPREVPRLWDRHVLNCAAVADAIPKGDAESAEVIDVGSGAGLPGIVLAISRPELTVRLVEPMARRTAFLATVVESLELTNVTIHRARAEELVGEMQAPFVIARALAPLRRLVRTVWPLVAPGGKLLAMKGASVRAELDAAATELARLGPAGIEVKQYGVGVIDPPVTVVEIAR